MHKNKIMYISPYLDSTRFGGSIVSWSNLEKLKSNNWEVITVCITRDAKNEELNYHVGASRNKLSTAFNNILGFSGRLSYRSIDCVINIINNENPDIVYLDSSYLGRLAKNIKIKFPHIKIISFFHNIEYDFELERLKKRELQYLPSFWSAWLNERQAIRYSDILFMLHSTDSDRSLTLYKRAADFFLPVTLPSCTGSEHNNISHSNFRPRKIGFFGTAFYANIEGAKYISNTLSPLLPEYEFIIAGKGFEKYNSELSNTNVSVLGTVESISQFYNQADIIIAPIFSGGGMKVKIAEALSYNKITIGSPFSLIGYSHLVDNINLFSASTTSDFVSIIKNLQHIDNPRKLFLEHFSNDSVSKMMIDEIKKELL
ncbi:glycosyltransferase [Morganella morganii]|uniref:glycosyltransferase n=1 Tax=Morganella morganii TaxID=582 RepID=UPI00128C1FB5|nr:glycosyltransferase [Morganella morganii]MQC08414.1 hypothetical protein [Morganella morganii]MQC11559.1 hypothetical protein [Morganella morganii]MQC15840.1 hypothetical protein [Morganella morganii]